MRRNARSIIFPRGLRIGVIAHQTTPPTNDPNPPAQDLEALNAARYEAEQARGEAARIKRQLEEIQRQMPTDEQRARYAELEAEHARAEEARVKKEGDFNAWREQITQKHERDLQAERSMRENADAKSRQIEVELEETLVGRCFADTTELFGPTSKTVLLPEVAQSFFSKNVRVETVGEGAAARRRVIVLDLNGSPILDAKTGKPMEFAKAMEQLIDTHPRAQHLLRGSGKVGAGSPGGAHGGGQGVNLSNLRQKDFNDPTVRDAVREQQNGAGGLQIGRAFDQMASRRSRK